MHHPSPARELGFIPSPFPPYHHISIPDMTASKDPSGVACHYPVTDSRPNMSWERRRLRKHRRRVDDDASSPKRRRLSGADESVEEDLSTAQSSSLHLWSQHCSPTAGAATADTSVDPSTNSMPMPTPTTAFRLSDLGSPHVGLPVPRAPSPLPLDAAPESDADGSCMEVEAAQRRLQEIENRITLEDDEEDLEVEASHSHRQPVLVLSDSLREGLQRGIGDILPHNVAQSVSQSCMQLVVWRPPEDALSRRLKDSLQRQQRKQHHHQQQFAATSSSSIRQSNSNSSSGSSGSGIGATTTCTPPTPPPQVLLRELTQGPLSSAYTQPEAQAAGEEDMEL
ncbi:coiled-coil domain-containing protein 117 [Engraulis encrasicolus]|uniref:coiled-coil domain-containing protein 117 n=1 Tax=Engraulis encrasicolus TaxID=184585 RepID=UPI002FD5EF4C